MHQRPGGGGRELGTRQLVEGIPHGAIGLLGSIAREAGEHEPEALRMLERKPHIGDAELRPLLAAQPLREPREALSCECGKQRLPVGKMPVGRVMRHPGAPGGIAQAERRNTILFQCLPGRLEKRGGQIAMVIC